MVLNVTLHFIGSPVAVTSRRDSEREDGNPGVEPNVT